MSVPTVGLNKS